MMEEHRRVDLRQAIYAPTQKKEEKAGGGWPGLFVIVFRLVRDVVANHKTTRFTGGS